MSKEITHTGNSQLTSVLGQLPASFSNDGELNLITVMQRAFDDSIEATAAERVDNLLWAQKHLIKLLEQDPNRHWAFPLALVGVKLSELSQVAPEKPIEGQDSAFLQKPLQDAALRSVYYALHRAEDGSPYQEGVFQIWQNVFGAPRLDQFLFGLRTPKDFSEYYFGTLRAAFIYDDKEGAKEVKIQERWIGDTHKRILQDLAPICQVYYDLNFRAKEGTLLRARLMELWQNGLPDRNPQEIHMDALTWLRTCAPNETTIRLAEKQYKDSAERLYESEGISAFLRTIYADSVMAQALQRPINVPSNIYGLCLIEPSNWHLARGNWQLGKNYYTQGINADCLIDSQNAAVQIITKIWAEKFTPWMLTNPGEAEELCSDILKREQQDFRFASPNNRPHPLHQFVEQKLYELQNPSTAVPEPTQTIDAHELGKPQSPKSLEAQSFLAAVGQLVAAATRKPNRPALDDQSSGIKALPAPDAPKNE